jgi:hypothetical protein
LITNSLVPVTPSAPTVIVAGNEIVFFTRTYSTGDALSRIAPIAS